MFKCSLCTNEPVMQCSSCTKILFCKACSSLHAKQHENQKTKPKFEPLTTDLSEEKVKKLRRSIKYAINAIEKQKNDIVVEASRALNQVKSFVNGTNKMLNELANDYKRFLSSVKFKREDLLVVEEIIEKPLSFQYPQFSKVQGNL